MPSSTQPPRQRKKSGDASFVLRYLRRSVLGGAVVDVEGGLPPRTPPGKAAQKPVAAGRPDTVQVQVERVGPQPPVLPHGNEGRPGRATLTTSVTRTPRRTKGRELG